MKVKDVLAHIDSAVPFALAEDWDNVGLMVGDPLEEVRRLGIALDPVPEAVREASRKECQALLTHHPLFFKPPRSLDLSAGVGETVRAAVETKVAVISAHTNWDKAEGGVNRVLARALELDAAPLVPSERGRGGLGAWGELPAAAPVKELLVKIKNSWNLTRLDYYGPADCSILRVALGGGSCGSLWPAALAAGAEIFVTADMKYHEILESLQAGLAVVVADHGEMESATLPELARRVALPGELEVVLLDNRALEAPFAVKIS